jgi:Bax protein
VLNANEKIKEQRERLVKIASRLEDGDIIAQSENRWLSGLAESYREDKSDLESLMLKVDTIPVSIAMAQAVEESGWGTSRFAREGNALFGQRVWSEGQGIVPSERGEGEVYEVRAFDTLADSVQAYTHNLNAHPAYEQFRAERARRSVEPENTLNGFKLADTLSVYSERGAEYVDALKNLIQTNRFDQFEKAELESERLAGNRY